MSRHTYDDAVPQVSLVSLSIAHDDMITLEGVESLVGLRSLSTLDISGCKVNPLFFFRRTRESDI